MKPVSVDPKATTRAAAFELWMNAPNPTVTFFKTLDVTPLVRLSRRRGLKFNMLMCYCIGRAASGIKEFLHASRRAGASAIRQHRGQHHRKEPPRRGQLLRRAVSDNLDRFSADYLRLTRETAERCENHDLTESMVIGTSAIVDTEIDGAVGMYSGIFNNPFIIWGKYHGGLFRTTLKLSFQFHHTQMDGAHAGRFLRHLQESIYSLKQKKQI